MYFQKLLFRSFKLTSCFFLQNDYVYANLRISKNEVATLSKQNDSTFVNKIFKLLLNDEILKKYCSDGGSQEPKDQLQESNEYKMMKCK